MAYKFQSQLGTSCQQRAQAQVPICVITTLRHDELLFAHVPVGGGGSTWVVQSVVCSIQRFWNSSTATINIGCDALDAMSFPTPLPTITNPEDNITHQFGPEDNICIWLGYVNSLFVDGASLISMMEGENPKLLRVFVGVVDTMGIVGTDNGYKYTIQCRDRMRFLMDTQVSLSPFNINDDRSSINFALGGRTTDVDRSDTILKLAQMGVGHINLDKDESKESDLNGMRIDRGIIADLGKIAYKPDFSKKINPSDMTQPGAMPPLDYFYNYDNAPLAGKTRTLKLDLRMHPKFNIITSRLPFSTESVAKEFTIEQQIPIELIKWLSNQESYPTEVFNSPTDGNFYYVPRSADISGLTDPKRFYRTYYYRFQPDGLADAEVLKGLTAKYPSIDIDTTFDPKQEDVEDDSPVIPEPNGGGKESSKPAIVDPKAPMGLKAPVVSKLKPSTKLTFDPLAPFNYKPDWAQGIINWREEFTTNAMYTNYLIANNSPNNTKDSKIILMHLCARPPFLSGRSIAGRNMYVIDETIGNSTEARSVGMQLARIHSKETRSASMTLIGDPTLTPGEIIQAIGSPLHQELNTLDTIVGERLGAVDFLKREAISYEDTLAKIKGYSPENEQVLMGNGSTDAEGGNKSPSNEFNKGDKVHAVEGKMYDNSGFGSLGLLESARHVGQAILFTPGTDPFKKVESGKGLDPDPKNATPTTSTAPASTAIGTAGTAVDADQKQMIYPYPKPYLTFSGFGLRRHPVTHEIKFHGGVDIGASTGIPYQAVLKGVVSFAGVKGFFGNLIVIDHGNGLQSYYGHSSRILVQVGQQVSQGTTIGLTGATGRVTGPHLHLELRKDGTAVPVTFLPFKNGYTPSQAEIDGLKGAASNASKTPADALAAPVAPVAPPADKANSKQVTPVSNKKAASPLGKYVNILVLARTGHTNELGLEDLKLTIYNGQGSATFSATANSGLSGKQKFGELLNDKARFNYPLPFGEYTISSPIASTEPGVGGIFIALTPQFKTQRDGLGIHWDADRLQTVPGKVGPPEPGTHGCVGITTKKEFDAFNKALVASGIHKMLFTKAGANDPIVSTPSEATPASSSSSIASPQEVPANTTPVYADEDWKKSHYNQDPQSLFRIEAVKHSFNSSGSTGYTVEVVLFPIAG